MHTYMHAYTYTCIHAYMHTHTHIHTTRAWLAGSPILRQSDCVGDGDVVLVMVLVMLVLGMVVMVLALADASARVAYFSSLEASSGQSMPHLRATAHSGRARRPV